ncbi:ASCH domain-containing protein [Agrobacterium tumefaciens]|uniref:ASCH domain-containing protein n=1 Tax=Agrobacterium tumefaciens TaxID=358 RepID=UPI00157236F1|nr:ASCH domain-containing protein [Agrobacterium tumefaciens]NTA18889.1 ASCH domain-containing protein [Agrobacterium tumefaciens]WCK72412.1 ASCH domain-containing protein [Agrobacterium tumefaciens]
MQIEFDKLLERTSGDRFWSTYIASAMGSQELCGVHLAIFSQPYLDLVLAGEKKIESRFSRNKCAPFEEVRKGDIILIKEVSGPICGVVLASRIWYFDLDIEPIDAIRRTYGHSILADDSFWLAKEDSSFATLIELERPSAIEPLDFEKRDRRGWVSLRPRQMDLF